MRWDNNSNDWERRRMVFPRSVKNNLFMAQKGRCAYCGRLHRIRYLEIDHKHPFSRGGGDEIDNLQLLCTPCNMRKGIQSDEEFRHRYWRLLPGDGSIPSPPIPQEVFTSETQVTMAPYAVRAIYRERFAASRKSRRDGRERSAASRRSRRDGCGLLVAAGMLVILVLITMVLLLS